MFKPINHPVAFALTLVYASLFTHGSQAATASPSLTTYSQKATEALPKLMILATGGTIAGQSTGEDSSSIGYTSGAISPRVLLAAVPGLDKKAHLSSVQVASIGSQDMNDKIWFDLAQKIDDLFSTGAADAIIITHGTDTLEETAFFLSLVIHHPQPVIITGAMRPATATGADGPANLLESVNTAVDKQSKGRGVMIVMNDTIQSPIWSTKSDTTGVATFQSPYAGPLGYVDAAEVHYITPVPAESRLSLQLPASHKLPRVEIIYAHSNMDDVQINNAVRDGAKGIILAGVGDGNTSASALAALKAAREHGLVVVRASRSYTGAVKRNVEVDDNKAGFVVSSGLNPAKARILTQLLLANGKTSPENVQAAFWSVTGHKN
ncbi:asparaginase [Enterobacter pseudoroggenkampii]|uniref:asparaginase n=1 Tax=Enterobacter pseudoroggenkampii TaxID=2996112 RepID=UPI00226456A4|nr:asparaginase [Enterobacter pseudoroggenkampii]MCX8289574.1 asparaginase [Enterobacter pseudoroggenkampii]